MNLIDIENREKAVEEKFRVFRNIYRTPILAELPWNLFLLFFGSGVIALFILIPLVMSGHYLIALVVLLIEGGFYYLLRGLYRKHGHNFLDKLGSFYTMNTFNEVRINRKIQNVVINNKREHGKD